MVVIGIIRIERKMSFKGVGITKAEDKHISAMTKLAILDAGRDACEHSPDNITQAKAFYDARLELWQYGIQRGAKLNEDVVASAWKAATGCGRVDLVKMRECVDVELPNVGVANLPPRL